tara:strand:+ start:2494 stop:2745 length:252 start_codon:yes stop_codon:yes gene_type:complete
MSSYGSAPAPDTSPPPSSKKTTAKKSTGKLSDKQKADLKKHMAQHKDLKDMTPSQLKSHRMKMMVRMRRGLSLQKAHKEIMKK